MTVRLQTAGVSLLAPRLTVLDPSGAVVADLASAGMAGDTLQARLPAIDPGATYHVEVRGAAGDVFGVGEYALAVRFDGLSVVGPGAIDTLSRQSYSDLSPDDINATFLDPGGVLGPTRPGRRPPRSRCRRRRRSQSRADKVSISPPRRTRGRRRSPVPGSHPTPGRAR